MILEASEDDLKRIIRQSSDDTLNRFFGYHADQIRAYAQSEVTPQAFGDSLIVVLPGFPGSVLEDIGSPRKPIIWPNPLAFALGRINYLNLDEEGLRDEVPGVDIQPKRPIWFVYAKIMLSLNIRYHAVAFPYDWSRAPSYNVPLLRDFIDQQLASTPFDQVTMVGHSFGGVVTMNYLASDETSAHAEQFVKRAITLGTPFRGSLDAILALADPSRTGRYAIIDNLHKRNDVHRALLSWPGAYHLLPAPLGLYSDGFIPVPDIDLYDPMNWYKANVPIKRTHLEAARAHHEFIAAADPQVPVNTIVGVNKTTASTLTGQVLAMSGAIQDSANGDGVVPIESAMFRDRPVY